MNKFMNQFFKFLTVLIAIIFVSACGTRFTGTYNLTQQGGQFQQNAGCSQITLSINESGNQITGQGQNQCFSETLQGTTSSNGQAQVTLMVYSGGSGQTNFTGYPSNNYYPNNYYPSNFYQNSGGMGCAYQGILTISGNTVTGSLNPTGNCVGQGSITLNGTKN